MRKVSHKILLLVVFTVLVSSAGGAWLALRGLTSSKEDEVLEKTARAVLSITQTIHDGKDLNSPQIKEAISSWPLFGVGIVDLESGKILHSNGGLSLEDQHWDELRQKSSSAAVYSVARPRFFLSSGRIGDTPYSVVVTVPRTSVWPLVKEVFRSYLLLLFIMAIVLGIIATLVVRAMVRPIEELTKNTELLAKGQWDLPEAIRSRDEIGVLYRAFHRLGVSLRSRESTIKKMHEELALREKLAMMGRFSAGIAHEIKNPLASLSTHLQLLERQADKGGEELPQKVKDKTTLLREEVERANRIVSDILSFSRQDRINRSRTSMREYLVGIASELAPVAEARNAELEVVWEGTVCEVEIDREKFRQVLANLLSNSLDALDGKKGKILWRGRFEKALHLEISDDGPGVPEENRSKLFDPFFTTKPAGKGTGLGLSFCHGIIDQHGGELSLLPTSSGTTFLLTIPGPISGA